MLCTVKIWENELKCDMCSEDKWYRSTMKTERNWNKQNRITDEVVMKWLSKDNTETAGSLWLFHPRHGHLKLLTTEHPLITSKPFIIQHTVKREETRSPDIKRKIFVANREIFISVQRYILNKLKRHHQCISQLWELKKGDMTEFPEICPYAYAYVFWRKSLLELDHFYRRNIRGDDIDPPQNNGSGMVVTKIIKDELHYLVEEFTRQTKKTNDTVREAALIWILNRVTAELSINFFNEWFKIAGEAAGKEYSPNSTEVERIKNICFPKIAFKYDVSLKSSIECISLSKPREYLYYKCPNKTLQSRKKLAQMKSHLPSSIAIAMKGLENSNDDNKRLQAYVDRYVSKF